MALVVPEIEMFYPILIYALIKEINWQMGLAISMAGGILLGKYGDMHIEIMAKYVVGCLLAAILERKTYKHDKMDIELRKTVDSGEEKALLLSEKNKALAVKQFLNSCCYGEKNGIAILTIEEQKLIFRRLSDENYEIFRRKQSLLFGKILECFGIKADKNRIALFTNLSLTAMIVCRAIPDTLPLFVPEVARETVDFQIEAIIDRLEQLKEDNPIL